MNKNREVAYHVGEFRNHQNPKEGNDMA